MKVWRILIAVALIGGAVAITAAGLRERPTPPVEVQLATAQKGTITRTIAGAGKVQAATTVKISSNLSGDLTELLVKVGDRVQRGQVLGRIERRRFEAAVKQSQAAQSASRAEMQLVQVEVDRSAQEYARVEGLVQKGMASAAELDRSRAERDTALARIASSRERLAQASAGLEEAQTALSKTTLYSPIDGTVIEVTREVGERVRGSDFSEDVVMTIAALAAMEVKIEVGEHEVVHLELGQKSDVSIDALEGQTFGGEVVEIAQKATIRNQGTENEVTYFPVTVALPVRPPGVLPGMSSEVRISAQRSENALVVPVQAVTVRPEKSLPDAKGPVEGKGEISAPQKGERFAKVVFVVDQGNTARIRRVRTGISSDTQVEILEGLQEGDKVVEGPYRALAKELKDGDRVEQPKPGAGFKKRRSRG